MPAKGIVVTNERPINQLFDQSINRPTKGETTKDHAIGSQSIKQPTNEPRPKRESIKTIKKAPHGNGNKTKNNAPVSSMEDKPCGSRK